MKPTGTSYLRYDAIMKGSIHSDQVCPICGSRFRSVEPRGLFCPIHPEQSPRKFVVRYGKITKRFDGYKDAHQFLTGLRFQEGPTNSTPETTRSRLSRWLSTSWPMSGWL